MLLVLFYSAIVVYFSSVYAAPDAYLKYKHSDSSVPCERGWYYFNMKCYRFGGGMGKQAYLLPWDKASDFCKSTGGKLVTIESQEEQDFLSTFLLLHAEYVSWIGLRSHSYESDNKWSDGSIVNYTNWRHKPAPGARQHGDKCAFLVIEPENAVIGPWAYADCGRWHAYICEKDINLRTKSPNEVFCSSEAGKGWKLRKSCYHIVTEKKSWENAEKHCRDVYNGHLVTILDITVDFFIEYIAADVQEDLWIGLKMDDELQPKWTSGWYAAYEGFKDEPEFFIEDICAVRRGKKDWLKVPCSSEYSFICEKSEVGPPVLRKPPKGYHCPDTSDDWMDLGGEYCYYIEKETLFNWYEASFACQRRGGNLVSLHSKEETEALLPFVRYCSNVSNSFHIGLLRLLKDERRFAWSDGSPVDYEYWNDFQPSNIDEKCTEIWFANMIWNDISCNIRRLHICSVKKVSPTGATLENVPRCSVTPSETTSTEEPEYVASMQEFMGENNCFQKKISECFLKNMGQSTPFVLPVDFSLCESRVFSCVDEKLKDCSGAKKFDFSDLENVYEAICTEGTQLNKQMKAHGRCYNDAVLMQSTCTKSIADYLESVAELGSETFQNLNEKMCKERHTITQCYYRVIEGKCGRDAKNFVQVIFNASEKLTKAFCDDVLD